MTTTFEIGKGPFDGQSGRWSIRWNVPEHKA